MAPNFSQSEAGLTWPPHPGPMKKEIFEMTGTGNNRTTGLCGGTDRFGVIEPTGAGKELSGFIIPISAARLEKWAPINYEGCIITQMEWVTVMEIRNGVRLLLDAL